MFTIIMSEVERALDQLDVSIPELIHRSNILKYIVENIRIGVC